MAESAERLQDRALEDFARALRGRRSIDLFEPDPPATETLLEAIETARWAPNHKLTEPWRFYIVGNETRRRLTDLAVAVDTARKGERAGLARRARLDAIPAFFVMTCRRTADDEHREREDYAACCCAAQNLMLYLWQGGIGVKWTTGAMTRDPGFAEVVGFNPDEEFLVGFFWYGRPRVIPERTRHDVADIVTECP